MRGWSLSWRAIGAWLAAALITGAAFGVSLSVINQWVAPQDRADFWSDALALSEGAAIVFAIVGGVVFLVGSLLRRFMPWPRPWVDAVVLAACFLGFIAEGLSFNLGAPMTQLQNLVVHTALPATSGVVLAFTYWLLAPHDRGVSKR